MKNKQTPILTARQRQNQALTIKSRQNQMLEYGISKMGNTLIGQLYEKKITFEGIPYFEATLDEPINFIGVMHTSSEIELKEDTNATGSRVTLETALDIENLFGDNANMVLIVQDLTEQTVDGMVIFGKQNDYNQVNDIFHYIGEVVPSTLTPFILPNGNTPPALMFNCLPLLLNAVDEDNNSVWQNIPVYAGYSLLANATPPYIVVNSISSESYQFPTTSETGVLDSWLKDKITIGFINVPANTIQQILNTLYNNAQNGIPPIVNTPFMATSLENMPNTIVDLTLKKQYYIGNVNYHYSQTDIAFQKIKQATINWS
jgi:hypothetical protein